MPNAACRGEKAALAGRFVCAGLYPVSYTHLVAGDVLPGQTVRVDVDGNGELTATAETMAMPVSYTHRRLLLWKRLKGWRRCMSS